MEQHSPFVIQKPPCKHAATEDAAEDAADDCSEDATEDISEDISEDDSDDEDEVQYPGKTVLQSVSHSPAPHEPVQIAPLIGQLGVAHVQAAAEDDEQNPGKSVLQAVSHSPTPHEPVQIAPLIGQLGVWHVQAATDDEEEEGTTARSCHWNCFEASEYTAETVTTETINVTVAARRRVVLDHMSGGAHYQHLRTDARVFRWRD